MKERLSRRRGISVAISTPGKAKAATVRCLTMAIMCAAGPTAWGERPLYWDVNFLLPGAGGPVAAGMWDLAVSPNWSPDPAGAMPTGFWVPGSTAVFSAGADAVGVFGVGIPAGLVIPGVDGIGFEEGAVAVVGGPGSGIMLTLPLISTAPLIAADIDVPIGGPGVGLTKLGAGMLTINATPPGPLAVAAGSLVIDVGAPPAVNVVPALALAGGAAPVVTLDINNNAFVVDYAPADPSPLPVIMAQIASAYAGGTWAGAGITTSMGTPASFGVGYAEAAALPVVPPIFGPVDATSVLLRFTRYGDADLDGVVGLADFNRLAGSFGTAGNDWSEGNFNYDAAGIVNLADFNLLAANFGLIAGPDATVDPEDWAALAAAVPEPGVALPVGLLLTALRRARRR